MLSGTGSEYKLGWKLRRLGRLGRSSSPWTLSRATLWALQGLWRRILTPERAERSRPGTDRWQVYADLAGARCSSSMQQPIRDGRIQQQLRKDSGCLGVFGGTGTQVQRTNAVESLPIHGAYAQDFADARCRPVPPPPRARPPGSVSRRRPASRGTVEGPVPSAVELG